MRRARQAGEPSRIAKRKGGSRTLAPKRTMAGVGAAWALASAPAHAQSLTAVTPDARTWRPSADADASMVLEPAATAGPGAWTLGAWTQYAQDSVAFRPAGNPIRPIEHSLGLDVTAGLGLGTRVAVGIDVPLALWQTGTSHVTGPAVSTALGDVSALGKVTLLSNDHQGVHSGFGLAALVGISLPTGNGRSYLSTGSGLGGRLQVLTEYALGIGALRAELGYSAPGAESTWPPNDPGAVTFGNTIPWSFGLVVRPKVFAEALDDGDRQLWEIAAHGALPAGPVAPFGLSGAGAALLSPALLGVDDRVALGHHHELFVLAGADLGLDTAIGVPTIRAVVAVTWAPRSHDKDSDGVDDDKDECPDLPEDHDGIQDADGCPEDDADGDAILDPDDACPLVPGVPSSDPKQNGCPVKGVVTPPLSPPEEGSREKTP